MTYNLRSNDCIWQGREEFTELNTKEDYAVDDEGAGFYAIRKLTKDNAWLFVGKVRARNYKSALIKHLKGD